MMGNIEAYLACCQLGITMASLGLGWVGEPTVAALLKPVLEPLGMPESALHFTAFITGFLVFSSLHIVIGEQVPKTLAIREPIPVSQWIAYPLHISYLVLYPLNWLLNGASRGILRLLGVKESSQNEILTDSEIEGLVEESAEHGKIESGEAEYIQNVFRFGDLAVSDVMVHRTKMVSVNVDGPRDAVIEAILDRNTPAFRSGARSRRTSSVFSMPEICCAPFAPMTATCPRSTLRRWRCRRGSFRKCGRCRSSSRPSAAARPISHWWSMSMARSKVSSRWKIFWKRSSAIFPTSTTSRSRACARSRTARWWSMDRCRSAISTARWIGICPTRKRQPSPVL
jgi:hypothetical protein